MTNKSYTLTLVASLVYSHLLVIHSSIHALHYERVLLPATT